MVFSCGINNIREASNINVTKTFNEFKDTIDNICKLKKNINIFISPILPTRSAMYNARAIHFNKLIRSQIIDNNYYQCTMLDVSSFCDRNTDLLNQYYSRGDLVHLNHSGTRKFANVIKESIYLKYNSGKRGRINSRKPYSAALQEGLGAGTPSTS